MPVYMYQGLETGETFSIEQRISEAALTHNPANGEPVKRIIGKPAISFKGTGFYANDSKSNSSSKSSKAETSSNPTTESTSSESKSESKPEVSKPAETTATAAPAVKKD